MQTAIDKGDTVRARLPQPISVYLLYWTAFASANGQVSFRADPYGGDDTLANKVAVRARQSPMATAHASGSVG